MILAVFGLVKGSVASRLAETFVTAEDPRLTVEVHGEEVVPDLSTSGTREVAVR